MREEQLYVKLKDNNRLSVDMKEELIKNEQNTYEKKFPFEDEGEIYFSGTYDECKEFIKSFQSIELKEQFEIIRHS